ncbi:MAG: hypothetical protein VYD59_01835 [Bacteroidota bacterium]|nr:hypothetical protein [Bacteroidota bacterium]
MAKKSLNIIYHWFPHYREILFLEISNIFNLKLIGANKTNYNNLKLINHDKFNFFEVKNIWIGPFLYQKGLISYIKNCKDKRFVFLGDWKFITTWIILIFFSSNKKFIAWTHGVNEKDFILLKFIKYIYYSMFAEVITYNEKASSRLNKLGIISRPIYNANTLPFELPKKTGEEVNWLFVGRITRDRLIIEFINEMIKSKNKLNNVIFHIIGPCDFSEEIYELISLNNFNQHVVYHGVIYNQNTIINISKSCKYFIHPSDIGLSALLALNLNLILFTHDDIPNHKPEIEPLVDSNRILKYRKNHLSIDSLFSKQKSFSPNYELIRQNQVKWSISNQVSIFKKLFCGER